MEILHQLYIDIFLKLYPLIHNHFVSYLLFLVILAFLIFQIYKIITKNKKSKFKRYFLLMFQGFLISYMAWYVLVFFHTYKNFDTMEHQPIKTAQNTK
ncbi:hypothetical protein DID75_00985 [Candidatus Marinamargulisbacteria bacterium SCGC AG-410-N11]|nr:hypothetical protein DID75_00985 [Candidatus Marinamargulisbacteria bacterium SCGC AG-410-N11]